MSLSNHRLVALSIASVMAAGAGLAHAAPAQALLPLVDPPQPEIRSITLPVTGVTVTERKALDPRSGKVVGGVIDTRGNAVDLGRLVEREMRARAKSLDAKYAAPLWEAVQKDPLATQPVVLWLTYDDELLDEVSRARMAPLGPDPSTEELHDAEASVATFAMEMVAGSNAEARDAIEALGAEVRYVSTSAPALFIDATPAQLKVIAALDFVETLYLESDDAEDQDFSSHASHRTTTTQYLGWKGNGVRLGVLENNGISPDHPYLNVFQWFDAANPNPDAHVQATAGCIASKYASRLGGADRVRLYSANARSYSDTEITRAADWIVTRHLDLTNMSYGANRFGEQDYLSRYFDYQSRVYQDSYVAAAGNNASFVGSPGQAWNCVTVGAFDDRNTPFLSGDRMASFSSWRNPANGCIKPNLAASGQSIDTLGLNGSWLLNGTQGTSFSAPYVSAALAVTMEQDASARVSPEAAMAAMMASAWHNIEGATRLSDRDGAGGLHQLAAAQMGDRNGITYFNVTRSSFSNAGFRTYNLYLQGGDRTRVAIAWSANASGNYTSAVLNADLDLSIYGGYNATSGVAYAHSFSGANNYEIVEFTPPSTGYYTVRVNDWRFDGASERVGLAWSQRTRDSGW